MLDELAVLVNEYFLDDIGMIDEQDALGADPG
jgi:hypothetical protein